MTKKTFPKRTIESAIAVALALSLVGCSKSAAVKEAKADRAERLYKTAMADYTAGRIDAAIKGFEKVLQTNPGNSSARFQLASLLQDRRRDYLAAMCQYREYLLQSPNSEKAALARERAEICERQYASHILNQMKDGEGPVAKEIARLRASEEKNGQEIERLKAELEKAIAEKDSAMKESERIRRLVSSLGDEESTDKPSLDIATARMLLDEEDDEGVDRLRLSADVKDLLAEEESETAEAPFAAVEPKPEEPQPAESAKQIVAASQRKKPLEPRPEKYVVQEGDTLYKIALRFYGKRSVWTKIRDANKATISTDGRVNAGVTITLPEE